MAEEQGKQAQAAEIADLPATALDESGNVRPGAFKGIFEQLKQERAKAEELERRFADFEAQRQAEEDARKRAELESQGKYEEALGSVKSEYEKRIAEYEAKIAAERKSATEAALSAEMAKLGVAGNPIIESGIRAMYFAESDGRSPAEWAAEVAKSEYFQALAGKQGIPAPRPVVGADRSGSGKNLAERLVDKDPSTRSAARAELDRLPDDRRAEINSAAYQLARMGRQER